MAAEEGIAPAVAIVHKDNQDIYYANNRKNKQLEETYLADTRNPRN